MFAPSCDVRVIEVYVNEPRQHLNESDRKDASSSVLGAILIRNHIPPQLYDIIHFEHKLS